MSDGLYFGSVVTNAGPLFAIGGARAGPRPHPTTHETTILWVVGWERGPAEPKDASRQERASAADRREAEPVGQTVGGRQ